MAKIDWTTSHERMIKEIHADLGKANNNKPAVKAVVIINNNEILNGRPWIIFRI